MGKTFCIMNRCNAYSSFQKGASLDTVLFDSWRWGGARWSRCFYDIHGTGGTIVQHDTLPLSSSSLEGHKATPTMFFQRVLSFAVAWASPHESPISCSSAITVFRHVVFVHPGFLLPGGVHITFLWSCWYIWMWNIYYLAKYKYMTQCTKTGNFVVVVLQTDTGFVIFKNSIHTQCIIIVTFHLSWYLKKENTIWQWHEICWCFNLQHIYLCIKLGFSSYLSVKFQFLCTNDQF